MTVRDAKKPPPSGSSQEALDRWINETVWERLNIDAFKEVTTPASGDEVQLFDVSADASRKITLSNLFAQSLLVSGLGIVTGSWDPVLAGSSTAGTQGYDVQLGRYFYSSAIQRCWVDFMIELNAKDGTTAGNLRITGLPYTVLNVTGYRPVAHLFYSNLDLNVGAARYTAVGLGSENTTRIDLVEIGDNVANAALTDADFGATTVIRGSMNYRVEG